MGKLLKGNMSAILLPVTAVLLQTQSALAHADSMGTGWHEGLGWRHMFFGSFMMLLFWGGLIILIFVAVRWMGAGSPRGNGGPASGNRALDILDERYARGEIEKQEYEERRRLLSK